MSDDENNPKVDLSKASIARKTEFLSTIEDNTSPQQLSAKSLPQIIQFYKDKYGIDILVNFSTEKGKSLVLSFQQAASEEVNQFIQYYEELLADLQNDDKKYVSFFIIDNLYQDLPYIFDLLFIPECRHDLLREYTIFEHIETWEKLAQIFKLYSDQLLNPEMMTPDQLIRLNQAIQFIAEHDEQFRMDFDKALQQKRTIFLQNYETLRTERDAMTYPSDQVNVASEILSIQQSMGDGDRLGYIFTNGHSIEGPLEHSYGHFEVLIITKNAVYKPVSWNTSNSMKIPMNGDIQGPFFDSKLLSFVDSYTKTTSSDGLVTSVKQISKPPVPQVTSKGCGTLGLLYLKELLKPKEGIDPLLDEAFIFSIPKAYGEFHYILPSAECLKYSQFTTFNKVIDTMIMSDEITVFNRGDYYISVKPVKFVLEKILKRLNNLSPEMTHTIQSQIDRLIEFRKKWPASYALANAKRETMKDRKGLNQYQSYKAAVFFERADSSSSHQGTLSKLRDFLDNPKYIEADSALSGPSSRISSFQQIRSAKRFKEIKQIAQTALEQSTNLPSELLKLYELIGKSTSLTVLVNELEKDRDLGLDWVMEQRPT